MTSDQYEPGVGQLMTVLAGETIDWMAESPETREDVADEVWAYTLASFVSGRALTPLGHDVSDQFGETDVSRGWCVECSRRLTDEPSGSSLCRTCFFDGWGAT